MAWFHILLSLKYFAGFACNHPVPIIQVLFCIYHIIFLPQIQEFHSIDVNFQNLHIIDIKVYKIYIFC